VLFLVAALIVGILSFWLELKPASTAARRAAASPLPPLAATGSPLPARATPAPQTASLREAIGALLAKLRNGKGEAEDLGALKKLLLNSEPHQAMEAILAFLKSGQDAPTGAGLIVGPGGALSDASTLRVFLMDLLGQLARQTGTDTADSLARAVLETKTSPDEWAISLRNVGWSEPNAKAYLSGKLREMLAEPSWTASPSAGLLESFDVIPYSGDPAFVSQLADLSQNGASSIQRAALVALDRLSETAPLEVMDYLNANPALISDHPLRRADYFAKADVTQPAQQAALENYLDRGDVGVDEKTKLLNELASPASFVSDTLLSAAPAPDDGIAHQQAYSALLGRWMSTSRFPALQGVMQQVQTRLAP
jgi:hypothetical protein